MLGRSFSADETGRRERLVMIGHRFWQTRFGGSDAALGATLVLTGVPSRIIGILPADFQIARIDADVWEPHTPAGGVRGGQTWFVMAAVGIYGLIQYSIATRTREIGLRVAVGAQAGDIFRMIISEGLTLSLIGAAIGLVGAWWLGRAGSSLLLGVTASDPLTFTTVSLLLTAVATAACYFSARRAMKLDPMLALRAM